MVQKILKLRYCGAAAAMLSVLLCLGGARHAAAQSQFSVAQVRAYQQQGDWQDCVNYAQAWSQAEPAAPDGWEYLGVCEGIGLQDHQASIAAFSRFLALQPDQYQAWNAIGLEYHFANDDADAAAAFKRATQLAPAHANYWNNLAAVESELGDWPAVATALDQDLAQAAPSGTWHDWYVLGNGFANIGAYEEAAVAYQHAQSLNPQSGEVWNNMGVVAQEMGQMQHALADYQQAAQLGNALGGSNEDKLTALLQPRQSGGGGGGGYAGGSGASAGGDEGGGGSCGYETYEACNAAAAGEFWSADRLDEGTASGSEEDFYSGD